MGTDLLLGTLPAPAPPGALLLLAAFVGDIGGVFLGILVAAPPEPDFLVGDSPAGCCVFSSTPLSWSPSVKQSQNLVLVNQVFSIREIKRWCIIFRNLSL